MIYLAIAAGIFCLDFFIKKQIEKKRKLGEETTILKERIIIRKYHNKGAMLDALEKWPWLVRVISGVILIVLSVLFALVLREKGSRGLKIGMAMILGGGLSNFYDRLSKGYVVDYFSFKSSFQKLQRVVFNISDLFIFVGTACIVLFRRK